MLTVKRSLELLEEEHSYANIYRVMCAHGSSMAAEYLDGEEIRAITYSDYDGIVRHVASRLDAKIPRGSFVGLKLDNSPMWPAYFWGILMSGSKPLLIDVKSDAAASAHVLRQAGAAAIITDVEMSFEGMTVISPDSLGGLLSRGSYKPSWADECALCTSGTTATSKVFVYNGEAMSNQMKLAQYIVDNNKDIMNDDDNIKNLAFLPLHHIFGFIAVYMWYTFLGKTVVYIKDRSPDTILSACRRHKVTHIYAVPLFWNNVAQGIIRKARLKNSEEKLRSFVDKSIAMQRKMGKAGRKVASTMFFKDIHASLVGDSVRFMISGGGHVLPETLKIINGIGYHLAVGFGMTETGVNSVETSNDIDTILKGSVGKPMTPTEYKIDDKGELKIRGNALHTGAMVDGVFIARDLADDGYFSSGDIASMSDKGYFIEGRAKEVIINESGENIYPDELEDCFIGLAHVDNYCVSGIANGTPYEDITLVAYLDQGERLQDALPEFIEELAARNALLPIFKKVRRVLVAKKPLPLANGIKVQRQKLKRMIEKGEFDCIEVDLKTRRVKETDELRAAAAAAKEASPAITGYEGEEFDKIKDTIRSLFSAELSLDPLSIGDTDHFIDDLGGDSLSILGVFTKAEEAYNLVIPDTEYFGAVNVLEFSKLIYEKLHGIEKPREEDEKQVVTRFEDSREFKDFFKRRESLEAAGSKDPYFIPHDSALRDVSMVNGAEVINLGSYNYVGFSGHPETNEAAKAAIDRYGLSASGSRLLAGEKPVHRELERAIAKWKHTDDSLVLVGGHSTNVTFVGNFCNENDLILYDALSHNSIVQGCRLSKSDAKGFPHNDLETLEYMLGASREKYEKILIVVEGVYSMDGDIAPVPDFVRLKEQYGAFLMVDEAHSSCVIGKSGGGVDDYFGLAPGDVDVKMGTLSKGLGTCGGYLAGSDNLITYLRYNVPGFVFSVGLSPALAAATLRAVEIMTEGNPAVARLHDNIVTLMAEAKKYSFNTCLAGETAIIPIMVGSDEDAFLLTEKLLERGIFIPPAVYPAVPRGQARLRISLTSEHKAAQLEYAMRVLDELYAELGIAK